MNAGETQTKRKRKISNDLESITQISRTCMSDHVYKYQVRKGVRAGHVLLECVHIAQCICLPLCDSPRGGLDELLMKSRMVFMSDKIKSVQQRIFASIDR